MLNLFEFFLRSRRKRERLSFFGRIVSIVLLGKEINEKKSLLAKEELSIMIDNANQYYISLKDFFELIEKDYDLTDTTTIISKFKHISSIKNEAQPIKIFSVVENNHIVLCMDKDSCEKHKDSNGVYLNIVTVKTSQ